jgi:hypothetical protein
LIRCIGGNEFGHLEELVLVVGLALAVVAEDVVEHLLVLAFGPFRSLINALPLLHLFLGFRVSGVGFRGSGFPFCVEGLEFRVSWGRCRVLV